MAPSLRRILGSRPNATEEAYMNPITQHHPASARKAGQAGRAPHRRWLRGQRMPSRAAGAGILGTAAITAVLLGSSLTASATPAQHARGAVGSPADSMLKATFTASAVAVTPDLGMVELILSGTGTVQGFGPATDVTGVVEDRTVSPCGAGGASDSAQKRIVVNGGVLVLHISAMLCMTASGPQVTGTYRVDGRASTGIFAGARGTGHAAADVTTGQETLSGTLILTPPAA
jgi:hypothetical protein